MIRIGDPVPVPPSVDVYRPCNHYTFTPSIISMPPRHMMSTGVEVAFARVVRREPLRARPAWTIRTLTTFDNGIRHVEGEG